MSTESRLGIHLTVFSFVFPLVFLWPFVTSNSNVLSSVSLPGSAQGTLVLQELLDGPLKGYDLFIFDDTHSSNVYWNEVQTLDSAVIQTSADEFDSTKFPLKTYSGKNFSVIWLIDSNDFKIDKLIEKPSLWCPQKLVVLSLSADVELSKLIDTKAIQCSKFAVIITPSKTFETILVYTTFPLQRNSLRLLGRWTVQSFEKEESLFIDRFATFSGSVLQLASWCDDYPQLYALPYPHNDTCVGSNIDALDIVSSHLNFTYNLEMEPFDCLWGSIENGTWTGMLAEIAYHGKNITINYFTIVLDRYIAFDSTYPHQAEAFAFMARLPKPLPKWKSVLYPYARVTWISIGVVTLLVAVMFPILTRIDVGDDSSELQISKALLLVAGALVAQSMNLSTFGVGEWRRVWMAVWYMGCVVFIAAYNGNLIAFLTVPLYPVRIETIKQLAESPLRVTMMDYGEFVPEALQASTDNALRRIGNKLDLFPQDHYYDPAMEMVENGTHALIEAYSYLMRLRMKYGVSKETYVLKEQVYSGYLTWFLPKYTPYTETISSTLQRLVEAGIVGKLYRNHFAKTDVIVQGIASVSSLSLDELQGPFLLLVLGLLSSSVLFLAELGFVKLKTMKIKSN
ncbi:Ionotropic receptor 115 [Hyalella azteca]|uniref:Ionotropic receptor 115 n=1 Tax=Hyalella azteca TaxID=294128 RepID=A0A6A0HDQ8_HYAAZ|nr:Ionotropic receptor 115 [Hyalella azteca]